MKKIVTLLFLFVCAYSFAQVSGGFTVYNDGHIYFQASNVSNYTFTITIVATSSDGKRNSENQSLSPGGGFYLGPSTPWHWYWKSGDRLTIIYPNGQSVYWECPQSDISYRSNQPSFKGKHCTGTVGCDCPGFDPITDGDVWEQSICRHCKHKKSCHK